MLHIYSRFILIFKTQATCLPTVLIYLLIDVNLVFEFEGVISKIFITFDKLNSIYDFIYSFIFVKSKKFHKIWMSTCEEIIVMIYYHCFLLIWFRNEKIHFAKSSILLSFLLNVIYFHFRYGSSRLVWF